MSNNKEIFELEFNFELLTKESLIVLSKDIFSLIGLMLHDAVYDVVKYYIGNRRFNSKKNKFYFPKEIIPSNGHHFVYEEHNILPDRVDCIYKCKKCNIMAHVMLDAEMAEIVYYFTNNNQPRHTYYHEYIGCTDFQLKNLLK